MSGKTHAMVLSGGGAHGAYSIGVMEALFKGRSPGGDSQPVRPKVFTGTSVGSYNAAIMVSQLAGRDPDYMQAVGHLRRLWLERIAARPEQPRNGVYRLRTDPQSYLDPARLMATPVQALADAGQEAASVAREWLLRSLNFSLSSDALTRRALQIFDASALFSTEPLRRLVAETIDSQRILSPEAKALTVAVTNWDSGKVVVFSNKRRIGDLGYETGSKKWRDNVRASYDSRELNEDNSHQAVLASTAIPGIFPSIELADENLVDGGLLMNTPLKPAIDAKAEVLHIVYFDPELEILPVGHVPNLLDTFDRMLTTSWAQRIREDIEYARMITRLIKRANGVEAFVGKEVALRIETDEQRETARRETQTFIDQFAGWPQITVHRYFPSRDVGGVLTMLDFRLERLIDLVELGFYDAVHHDCDANGCVVSVG